MDPAEVERAVGVNVIDESNLNDVMLNAGDPNEAVNYFQSALLQSPDRIDLQRGLAKSLVRAKKSEQAARVWADVVANDEA
ncbi:MAG: tetratricopeptide repeat protein, partial [Maritimibacter sp.]